MLKRLLALAFVAISTSAACSEGRAKIRHPIEVDLGRFETCAVEVVDPLDDGPRATAAFVAYLEGRLREEAVLEPVPSESAQEAEIRIRIRPATGATTTAHSVALAVDVVEAKDDRVVGSFDVSGEQEAIDGPLSGGPRGIALQRAADAIAATLKGSRRAATRAEVRARARANAARAEAAHPAPPIAAADDPFRSTSRARNEARPSVCLSTCTPPSSSAVAEKDLSTIALRVDPTLKSLRACLDRVGAELVEPILILRFGDGGQLVGMRVDLGGYEELSCVSDAWAAPPSVRLPRSGMVRCTFHCSTSRDEP